MKVHINWIDIPTSKVADPTNEIIPNPDQIVKKNWFGPAKTTWIRPNFDLIIFILFLFRIRIFNPALLTKFLLFC